MNKHLFAQTLITGLAGLACVLPAVAGTNEVRITADVLYNVDVGGTWTPGQGSLNLDFHYTPGAPSENGLFDYATSGSTGSVTTVSELNTADNAAIAALFSTSPDFQVTTSADPGMGKYSASFATTYTSGANQYGFSFQMSNQNTPGFGGWDGVSPINGALDSGTGLSLVEFGDGNMIFFNQIENLTMEVSAPEPSTLALLAISGTGALAYFRRRR